MREKTRTNAVARWAIAAALAIGVLGASVDASQGRVVRTQTTPAQPVEATDPRLERLERFDQVDGEGRRYIYARPAFRLWQDYLLKSTDAVRGVGVVSGRARIEGYVDGDVVVVLGDLDIASTAVIRGSVFVWAGNATIADGASIRRDLLVVGGDLLTPPGFAPGGEHVVVGAPWLGDEVRAVVPWLTRGLLWGRLIVPSIGWVWWGVSLVLIVTLSINLLLHEPVTRCAETLAARPFSAFLTGLLVLVLAAPVSALLAVTVVGIAVIPFALCAVVVAWIAGKVGVARWIGRSVTGQQSPESGLEALRSVVVGFAAICLVYMVPVLGIVAWALIGVFGLGAASLTFVSALRRERPAPSPRPIAPPPTAPTDLSSALVTEMPPPVAVPTPAAPPPVGHASTSSAPVGDLVHMPRATLLDRIAALALDAALLLIIGGMLDLSRHDGAVLVMMFTYAVAAWAWKGTTIGGIICNLRVTRIDGSALRFADALVRGLASVFSTVALGLGWLWILRDPERQAWHDKIAGTYVVKVPRNWPLP